MSREPPIMADRFHRIVCKTLEVEQYRLQIVACRRQDRTSGHPRMEPVVPIKKGDILSPGFFNSEIPCPRHASVFKMPDLDARIDARIEVKHLAAIVNRAVVDADDLKVRQGLPTQRFERARNVLLHIVHGNDKGDRRPFHHAGLRWRRAGEPCSRHLHLNRTRFRHAIHQLVNP